MGLLNKLMQKLKGKLAAKEVSPHSWANPKYTKDLLKKDQIENFLPHLKIYLGEDNFTEVYSKFKSTALTIERELNFICNTGEPLSRKVSFLLSFDIAKVMEHQKIQKIKQLRSIIVYPTYLPTESEAAGFMLPRGPRGFIEDLSMIRASIEVTNWLINRPTFSSSSSQDPSLLRSLIEPEKILNLKNFLKHFYPETMDLEEHYDSIRKGMDNQSLSRWKNYLKKVETFLGENYTIENIAKKRASATAEEKAPSQNLVEPKVILDRLKIFREKWDEVIPVDQFSIHLSWVHHLEYMAHQKKNLFVHELAHVLDFQHLHSFSFHGDSEWEKLRSKYLQSEGDHFELGSYALTNAKEFFAVSTEYYFRHPKNLNDSYPDIYKLLVKTYGKVPFDHQPISVSQIFSLVREIHLTEDYSKVS